MIIKLLNRVICVQSSRMMDLVFKSQAATVVRVQMGMMKVEVTQEAETAGEHS